MLDGLETCKLVLDQFVKEGDLILLTIELKETIDTTKYEDNPRFFY